MNTEHFIRKFTRKILTEAADEWERKDNRGRMQLGAKAAEGRAKADPANLLRDLEVKPEKVEASEILKQAINSNVLNEVFEEPIVQNGRIVVNVIVQDEENFNTAVGRKGSNGWRYLKAILDAAASVNILPDEYKNIKFSFDRYIKEASKECKIEISAVR